MTRIQQALRWWKNNVPEGEWKVDALVPYRHSLVLYRANRLERKWRGGEARHSLSNEIFWKLKEDGHDV